MRNKETCHTFVVTSFPNIVLFLYGKSHSTSLNQLSSLSCLFGTQQISCGGKLMLLPVILQILFHYGSLLSHKFCCVLFLLLPKSSLIISGCPGLAKKEGTDYWSHLPWEGLFPLWDLCLFSYLHLYIIYLCL